MKNKVSIAGLDKAAVLAALYNAAAPHGLGFLSYNPTPMDLEGARRAIAERHEFFRKAYPFLRAFAGQCPFWHFDYIKGRPIKANLAGDEMDTADYNAKHGTDAAERVLAALRATGDPNSDDIFAIHTHGLERQARIVEASLDRVTRVKNISGQRIIILGFADHAQKLREAIRITRGIKH